MAYILNGSAGMGKKEAKDKIKNLDLSNRGAMLL